MSLTIDLDPEVEFRLREKAALNDLPPEVYVAKVVQWEVEVESEDSVRVEARMANLKRVLAGIDEFGRRFLFPSLPDEALTREAITIEARHRMRCQYPPSLREPSRRSASPNP